MPKRDSRYERVYETLRTVASTAIREFKGNPDGGVVVAGAQAEAFVRTLKGYTLPRIKKSFHARYVHRLFSTMLEDALSGMSHLSGKIMVVETPKRKKR
jgi:hypothetical protein